MEYKQNEDNIIEMLWQSNRIEGEHSLVALHDAIEAWKFAEEQQLQNIKAAQKEEYVDIIYWITFTHFLLMKRLQPKLAGNLTTIQTYVGGRLNPKPEHVSALLDNWVLDHGNLGKDATAEQIEKAHIKLMHIHPFQDGNGRVGRIIMNMQRLIAGLPIIVVHPDGTKIHTKTRVSQTEYYKWF